MIKGQHWVTVRNENQHFIVVEVNGKEVIREVFVTGESQMNHSYNMTDDIALNGDCGGGDVYRLCHDAYEIYAGMEGFIPETAPEGYALQVIEQLGTAIGKAKIAALTALNGGKICAGKDELCPCQDGDMCHYKGENPFPIPSPVVDVEGLKLDLRELEMAAGIADTFHGRNCCAALDRIEEVLAARGLIAGNKESPDTLPCDVTIGVATFKKGTPTFMVLDILNKWQEYNEEKDI